MFQRVQINVNVIFKYDNLVRKDFAFLEITSEDYCKRQNWNIAIL